MPDIVTDLPVSVAPAAHASGSPASAPAPDALLIEGCNFVDFPSGGQLSEATQWMSAFGNRFALVGICTDDTPVGRWVDKVFGGRVFRFLGVTRADRSRTSKPLVPARFTFYRGLRRHMKTIRALGVGNVMVQSPEPLLAII